MTHNQHEIFKILDVHINPYLKYTDVELGKLAFISGKKFPSIQAVDFMARNAIEYAENDATIEEFRKCVSNVKRWTTTGKTWIRIYEQET